MWAFLRLKQHRTDDVYETNVLRNCQEIQDYFSFWKCKTWQGSFIMWQTLKYRNFHIHTHTKGHPQSSKHMSKHFYITYHDSNRSQVLQKNKPVCLAGTWHICCFSDRHWQLKTDGEINKLLVQFLRRWLNRMGSGSTCLSVKPLKELNVRVSVRTPLMDHGGVISSPYDPLKGPGVTHGSRFATVRVPGSLRPLASSSPRSTDRYKNFNGHCVFFSVEVI